MHAWRRAERVERSLTVDLQDGSDRPCELLRLLGERGRSPGTLLVARREALRRRSDFNVSGAAETEKESAVTNYYYDYKQPQMEASRRSPG